MTKRREHPQAPWANEKASRRSYTRDLGWATEPAEKLVAATHPKQRCFVEDPALRITALCGRGGGKTTAAIAKLLITMFARPKMPCLYIAVTREQATEIVWAHLKDILEKLHVEAVFSEVKRICTLTANGSTLRLCGADDRKEIDKLRGLAFAGVVIDEAASHDAALLENLIVRVLGPRLGEHNGWIALIGTPGHELRGMFYDATRPGSTLHRPYADRVEGERWLGWSSHHWTLRDGAPTVPAMQRLWATALVDKEANGWSDTHPIWLREYEARWAADNTENVFKYRAYTDDGAEWNVWDPPRVGAHQIARLATPWAPERDDWEYVLAFDKGFTDAFAINLFAFSPSDPGKTLFHVYGFEQTAFYARRMAELLLGEELNTERPGGVFGTVGWPVGIVGDTDEAFLAELANVYGIRAVAAVKKRDYKFGAVELTNGDLVDGRIRVLKGSKLEEQLLTLQWVTDEFGALHENKAQANHSTDTLIYARRLVAHMFDTGQLDAAQRKREKAAKVRAILDGGEPNEEGGGNDGWSDLLSSGNYDSEW